MTISLRCGSGLIPTEVVSFGNTHRSVPFRIDLGTRMKFPALVIRAATKPPTETVKRQPGGTGIMKPRRVSPEMREFLGGVFEIAQGQALKEIWVHIKNHNLQDPQDKKVVHCDEKLKRILGDRDQQQ